MPLTDTTIRNAKPGDKAKKLFDSGGLYLEVAPSGGKWWRLKYRFGGKEKRLSLGVYPEVSLKDARERRDEARKLLANEIDPSENRRAKKAAREERVANSFEVVAREWFAKHVPNWSESHGDRIIRRIERRGALETVHRALSNCGQVFRLCYCHWPRCARSFSRPAGRLAAGLRVNTLQLSPNRKRLPRS
ncbi:hypothetical protein NOC27_624 [Nitrosococcus oceani AFC27]|uniref:tyrosine-type recombinase/integrase n=1 Tax=Nitrosococcus oceani TaxID=1229 RepID=UPI000183C6B4|nr:Arm DNA-binding domain-containing protein [Nitrosococcus oceani]EDZ67297.1 hypothetical protein NOC27_624 [Nitrosococcus oceani AFC27]GEM19352.1 hypothetical protein NONS58_07370 [Nitrosococcus oceani]